MSSPTVSQAQLSGELTFDRRMLMFLNVIRGDVVQILQPGQTHPLSQAAVSCALETLKTVADTALVLAEKERCWSEKEKLNAHTKQLMAETELINTVKGKIQAETEQMKVQKQ